MMMLDEGICLSVCPEKRSPDRPAAPPGCPGCCQVRPVHPESSSGWDVPETPAQKRISFTRLWQLFFLLSFFLAGENQSVHASLQAHKVIHCVYFVLSLSVKTIVDDILLWNRRGLNVTSLNHLHMAWIVNHWQWLFCMRYEVLILRIWLCLLLVGLVLHFCRSFLC